jgi:hypothetical protein
MRCKSNSVHSVKTNMSTPCRLAHKKHHLITNNSQPKHSPHSQKDIDRIKSRRIIILTSHSISFANPFNDNQIEARFLEAAWHAQPASGRCARFPFSNRRVLRPGRCCAGEVRDAPPRQGGQEVGQPVRCGIRFFAADLLPGGRGFSARRLAWSVTEEARASARPQTHAGCSRFRRKTASKQSFVACCRCRRCDSRTVLCQGPYTEYRPCVSSAGKKTPLILFGGSIRKSEPQELVSAYEELRWQGITWSTSGGLGMNLFLGQGMAAWMVVYSWFPSNNFDHSSRCLSITGPLPAGLRGEMVLLISEMALKHASEVHL